MKSVARFDLYVEEILRHIFISSFNFPTPLSWHYKFPRRRV